jgi:SAM-dependent methyltransferase
MDIKDINWNAICSSVGKDKNFVGRSPAYWNRRAPSFARNSSGSDYAEQFLRFLKVRSGWTVLDVGCATGTLAIPLAGRVKAVTGLDISETMLAMLRKRCRELGIANVGTVLAGWEDDWAAAGIGQHDVAIASRSLITDDFRSAIEKLDRAARKRVYVSTIVGDGPYDRRIFEAIGRNLVPGPDYIYACNLLYQMGICANVNFITSHESRSYGSHDEAFGAVGMKLGEITPVEEEKLRAFLGANLIRRKDRWEFSSRRKIKWAVLWWDKA